MTYTAAQKRAHINELQRYLHAISYFDVRIPTVIPDGIYGRETETAVRAFQRAYGLKDTGNTDFNTWNKIISVYREYVNRTPFAYDIFPSHKYVMREGDSGLLVYILQAMLNDIGKRHDNMPDLDVNGVYDKATANAVRNFQRTVNLNQTGLVNAPTWNMLTKTSEHMNKVVSNN